MPTDGGAGFRAAPGRFPRRVLASSLLVLVLASSLLVLVLASPPLAGDPPAPPRAFAVFGYLPEYRLAGTDWNATLSRVTHLALFSLEVTSDAKLASLDRFPDAATFARIRAAADARGARVLVTLGGAGRTGGLPLVAASGPKRRTLVRTLVAFCRAKALDGVDFNWEYPRDDADFASLASLLRAASAPFRDANLVATMAYHPLDGRSEAFLASAKVARHVHLAHAMAYDRPDRDGRHASLALADATLAEARRADETETLARVVALGVPFYARHARTGEARTYAELVRELEREREREEGGDSPRGDSEAEAEADVLKNFERRALARGWSVDGPRTARAKVRAARDAGAAGVAVWELGQDLHPDDPRSLLRAIDEEARRGRADGAEGARGETRDEL